jgi:transcriptional regulator with XRE-family HTH domain
MLTHKQLRTQALADPAVKAEFDKLSDEFSLLDEFLKARTSQGLTQAQVAEKIGTTQSAVARLESGSGKHSPSLATLTKYADALGCKLEIRLVRRPRATGDLTSRPNQPAPKRAAA